MAGQTLANKYDLDTSEAEAKIKRLNQLSNQTSGSVGGGAGNSLATAAAQADKLAARFKVLEDAQKRLASQPGAEAALSKVSSEMASIISSQRRLTSDTSTYLTLLEREVQLRKDSKSLAAQERANSKAPSGGTGGGGDSGGAAMSGFASNASTAALGALAAIAYKTVDGLSKLTDQAVKDAQRFSDSGGRYDRLRASTEDLKAAQDKLASSPLFTGLAEEKNKLEIEFMREAKDLADWLGNKLAHFGAETGSLIKDWDLKNDKEKNKPSGLAGQDLLDYQKLIREAGNNGIEMAMQHAQLEEDIYRKRRDFEQEIAEYRIAQARRIEEREISSSRKLEDLTIKRGELEQDQAFKTSEGKYRIEREAAAREQQNRLKDAVQDFELTNKYDLAAYANKVENDRKEFEQKQSFDTENFNRQRQFDTENFNRQERFDKQRFGLSQSDKAADFSRGRRYDKEDYLNNLQDLGLQGGSAVQYFQLFRDFQKGQGRAFEQYGTDTSRAERDFKLDNDFKRGTFNIGQGQDAANFGAGQQQGRWGFNQGQARDAADFGLNQNRNIEQLNNQQARSQRDFLDKEADTVKEHALEVEQHYYDQRIALLAVERETIRTMDDFNRSMRNLLQDDQMQKRKFANQDADLNFDANMGRDRQAFSDKKTQESFYDSEIGFATQLRNNYSIEQLRKIALSDPYIASLLKQQGEATKNPFLFKDKDSSTGTSSDYGDAGGSGSDWGSNPYKAGVNSGYPNSPIMQNSFAMPITVTFGSDMTPALEKMMKDIKDYADKRVGELAASVQHAREEDAKRFASWKTY